MLTLRGAALLFSLVAAQGAAAQARVAAAPSLTTQVEALLAPEGLVGVTWALVFPESTVVGAAGLRDVRTRARMRPDDRVQVGSVAKTIVALAVLRLVTEGRIDLDAPVAQYLTDVTFDNAWEATHPVRVRHLLDHTAGLDDARLWQVFTLRGHPDSPLRDGLPRRGRGIPVRRPPGERFSYSNTGYLLAAMVIEAVTLTRYELRIDVGTLEPLGMLRSTAHFVTQSGERGDSTLAMGHYDTETPAASVAIPVRPASQFTTTAEDMARLARFLMRDDLLSNAGWVDTALLAGMGRPTTTAAARAGLEAGYALGLARRDRWGAIGLCHTGNVGNFRAAFCLYPEQQRAFFISYNTDPESANFDRIDGLLAKALGVSTPAAAASPERLPDAHEWAGWYVVRPSRFPQFRYLDEVGAVTRVRFAGDTLRLEPLGGTARALEPIGGALYRGPERLRATHVLLRGEGGQRQVADGLRTYERVSAARVYALWASAVAGVLGLLYVLVVGAVRAVRAFMRRAWREEPLAWPAVAAWAMVVAPLAYFTGSFLAIGDPTVANWLVAIATGVVPVAVTVGLVRRMGSGVGTRGARVDLVALLATAQWCVVLAWWGLVPLVLWG